MRPLKREDIDKLCDPTMPMEWHVWMQEELGTRCNYIVRYLTEDLLGLEVEWWDFDNAPIDPNDGPGTFDGNMYVSAFGVIGNFRKENERTTFLFSTPYDTISENCIPTSWIWMEDEKWQAEAKLVMSAAPSSDSVQQTKEGITRGIHEQAKKKMRDAIVAKLTPEELKYIVFKG